jgi:hypothetical protein
MSKLLLISFLLLRVAYSQGGPAGHVLSGTVLPTACSPLSGDIFVLYTGTPTGTFYYCSAVNTWSAGSGSTGPTGPSGATGPTGLSPVRSIAISAGNGGSAIVTGQSNVSFQTSPSPFSGTINEADIAANTSGSITIQVWRGTCAATPCAALTSVASIGSFALSSAQNSGIAHLSLSGITTAVAANSTWWATVTAADGVLTQALLTIYFQ